MNKKTNILFITWDSGDTNYLETLFLPIFSKIQENSPYNFFCLQYTWANQETIRQRKEKSEKSGIVYRAIPMKNTLLSKVSNILNSRKHIDDFCNQNDIHYLMPRSVWPAFITLFSRIKLPIIYDADGLAYLEKKEYGSSRLTTWLIQNIEKKIIHKSQLVFTRSIFAVKWYHKKYNSINLPPFQVVYNGVSEDQFYFDQELRNRTRDFLQIEEKDILFVYVGSLGKKYGIDKAISVFQHFHYKHPNSKFLILSSHTQKAKEALKKDKTLAIELQQVPHNEINAYLNAADYGFCFIIPSDAIKAVNPIKLNEYQLAGLPTFINRGIGDADHWLREDENCIYIENDYISELDIERIVSLRKIERNIISEKALQHCSLSTAVYTYLKAFNTHLS